MKCVQLRRKGGTPEKDKNCFCDCREGPGGSQIGAGKCAAIAGIPALDGASADPELAKVSRRLANTFGLVTAPECSRVIPFKFYSPASVTFVLSRVSQVNVRCFHVAGDPTPPHPPIQSGMSSNGIAIITSLCTRSASLFTFQFSQLCPPRETPVRLASVA